VLFPADRRFWYPTSPHIVTTQVDRAGRYVLSNVVPGEYRLAALALTADPWFDANLLDTLAAAGVAVSIRDDRPATVDLRVP